MHKTLLGIGLFTTGILTAGLAQATAYTLIPLTDGASTTSHAQALNNAGLVVGQCDLQLSAYWPACEWNNGVLVRAASGGLGLNLNYGGIYNGVNDLGMAVATESWAFGIARGLNAAYIWDGHAAQALPSAFGNAQSVDQSGANGINKAGQVAGWSASGTVGPSNSVVSGPKTATLWVANTPTALRTLGGSSSEAYALNNGNPVVVVGQSATAGDAAVHATQWTGSAGAAVDLGTLGGTRSSALGVNGAGLVVGRSTLAGDAVTHATLWKAGTIVDLGAPGGTGSVASGINTAGQIVGAIQRAGAKDHAMLWDGATAVDLNTVVVANPDGWELNTATAINDAGVIVGTMSKTALPAPTTVGYMLVPTDGVPQPTSTCTVGYQVLRSNSLTFTAELTIVNKSASASGAWVAGWTYATGTKATLLSSKNAKVSLSKVNGTATPLASAAALAPNGGSVLVSLTALDWGKLPALAEVHATLAGKACDVIAP